MWRAIGTITMLVLVLGAGVPAQAQTGERVLETISDLLRGAQNVQGWVVSVRDSDMVVRGRDNRTYTISTTNVDRQALSRLQPGQPVKVSVRRNGQTLVASSFEVENGEPRLFRTVNGVVDSVSGDRVQFKTSEGFMLPMDLAQVVGPKPSVKQGDTAMVTYEQTGQNPLTAVWIETRGVFPAASPRTTEPAGVTVTGSGYERIHGFVESVGLGTLTLKADNGRTMIVDLRNARGNAGDVRPGDLVNIVGRTTGERFVAETLQRD
jgi:hypothetical protein